jgi:hypothetical protein
VIQLIHKKFRTPKYYVSDDRKPASAPHKAATYATKSHADAEARLIRNQWGIDTRVIPTPETAVNRVMPKLSGPGGKRIK